MSYTALYRKYRPATFADIVGQEHITKTLTNQIKTGRISHAYLFSGIRGTGKTSCAKVLAKALNCTDETSFEPCGVCTACKAAENDALPDIVEIDAASNRGIEEIRALKESVKYQPALGKYKVYIIDEAHMLTTEAFNALLKTLEEPPEYVVFILATTEAHKLPQTIVSRTQRFDFRRLSLGDVTEHLKRIAQKEGFEAQEEALVHIAALSEGAMRDALSILDKCASYAVGGAITEETVDFITGRANDGEILQAVEVAFNGHIPEMLDKIQTLTGAGRDAVVLLESFITAMRELLIVKNSQHPENIVMRPTQYIAKLKEIGEQIPEKNILAAFDMLLEAQRRTAFAPTPIYALECALMMIAGGTDLNKATRIVEVEKAALKEIRQQYADDEQKPGTPPVTEAAVAVAQTTAPAEKKLSGKELKELQTKACSQLFADGLPLLAMAFERAELTTESGDVLNILLDDNAYSLFINNKEYQQKLEAAVRQIAGVSTFEYKSKKSEAAQKAKEAFGDIVTIKED